MEQSIPAEPAPTTEVVTNGHAHEDESLDLTDEETQQAPLAAGIRGQIKKLMRNFIHHQGLVMESMRKEIDNFQSRTVREFGGQIESTNKRFTDLYNGLVRQLFVQLKPRLYICEVTVQALIDETTARLHALSQDGQTAEEFKAAITKSLQARIAEIDRAYTEKLEKEKEQPESAPMTETPAATPAVEEAPKTESPEVQEEKAENGSEATDDQ